MSNDESHAQQEHEDSLVLELSAPACHRIQLKAISKARVNDANKINNLHVMIKLGNLSKKQ